jgi:hypothetical protein
MASLPLKQVVPTWLTRVMTFSASTPSAWHPSKAMLLALEPPNSAFLLLQVLHGNRKMDRSSTTFRPLLQRRQRGKGVLLSQEAQGTTRTSLTL